MSLAGRIQNRLEAAVDERVFPGASVSVLAANQFNVSVGSTEYEGGKPVDDRTIYDAASVTKSIPTGCLALLLVQRGVLGLDEPVRSFVPELTGRYTEDCLVRHLLSYTAVWNLPMGLSSYTELDADHIFDMLMRAGLKAPPGRQFVYTNAPAVILGLVIERLADTPLDQLAQQELFAPLGLRDTGFYPLDHFRIAPSEVTPWRGRIQGKVHDEASWILQKKFTPGSAGLFSTAADLAEFARVLLKAPPPIFSELTMQMMETSPFPDRSFPVALGWERAQRRFMGRSFTGRTFGKTGFTGCSVCIDRGKQVAWVIMSNATYPQRKEQTALNRLRSDIADLIMENAA